MKRTPFHQYHADHNAKLVDYAGWQMPLLFTSIVEEHKHVRRFGGIFDVSHMGRIEFTGRQARRFLERIFSRRVSDMPERACRYGLVTNATGGVKDDALIYRFEEKWMMVCNAANREKLLKHFDEVRGDLSVKINDITEKTGMLAVQGPKVMDYVTRFSKEIPSLKRYTFTVKNLLIVKLIVSRTGYTGEDGIEIILPANMVGMALKLLFKEDADPDQAILPCGLGARDSLRLEAGMPLYGHELGEEIDPVTAGLKWCCSLDKDRDDQFGEPEPFIGMDAIKKIAEEGPKQKLVGLKLDGRRTPRQDMTVLAGDKAVGKITSGCLSPTLDCPIAMAFVDVAHTEPGTTLHIDFGKQTAEAQVVKMPFYKHT